MDNGQQMRLSDDELKLIRDTFKGNTTLLKLLRKVFLPEVDPNAPINQVIDLWMTLDPRSMTPEMAYQNIIARNSLIGHVEAQLNQLNFLASMEDSDIKEAIERRKKDSAK